ncbi:MAG: hypothetical protein WD030_07260 [Pirellulales bacterium]
MTQRTRQQLFLEVAERLAVLDVATLTRLLHAVPDPEQAIQYLRQKQLIDQATAAELAAGYREAAAGVAVTEPRPAAGSLPSPPPRPGETADIPPRPQPKQPPVEASPRKPQPDTSEVDAFDALIDDILND